MSIIQEREERWWQQVVQSIAQKLYNKQLKDITNISHTDWYKEIKAYWERVKEWAMIQLETVEEKDLKIVQLKRNIASEFVMFLNNLEQSKQLREDVKN